MKNTSFYLLAVMLTGIFSQARSQDLRLGSRFSIGQSELISGFDRRTPGLMIGAGGSADYMLNKYIGLMGDAMFMQHTVQFEGRENGGVFGQAGPYDYTERLRFYRLEFPVMVKIRLGTERLGFRAYGGPNFGFHLLALSSREYDNRDYDEDYGYSNDRIRNMQVMNMGVDCSIGLEIKGRNNSMYFADLRSGNSLGSMGRYDGKNILIRHFCISAGYVF